MNSIGMDIVKSMLNARDYESIHKFLDIEHKGKNLIITEYAGSTPSIFKDKNGDVNLLYPKNELDVVMEGHVANAIANGTIFDDADDVDNNAEMIEKTSIPYSAMINDGKDLPSNVKPAIAIVIGKIDDNGSFRVSDNDRENGFSFMRELSDARKADKHITPVIDKYIDKPEDEFYPDGSGKEIVKLSDEIDEINDTPYEDTIDEDIDLVDDYGEDFDVDKFEKDQEAGEDAEEDSESDYGSDDGDGDNVDSTEVSDDSDDTDDDSNDDESDDNESDDKEDGDEEDEDEPVAECGDTDTTVETESYYDIPDDKKEKSSTDKRIDQMVEENTKYQMYEEGFLTKKPKKLKPIGRDVVAYITVMINDIHSANDQAMLSGYTCSKLDLVDFYITCIDLQDARYIVPHTRQYLVTMKQELEKLLAQILRIRPINRSEQIWRVNYPTSNPV